MCIQFYHIYNHVGLRMHILILCCLLIDELHGRKLLVITPVMITSNYCTSSSAQHHWPFGGYLMIYGTVCSYYNGYNITSWWGNGYRIMLSSTGPLCRESMSGFPAQRASTDELWWPLCCLLFLCVWGKGGVVVVWRRIYKGGCCWEADFCAPKRSRTFYEHCMELTIMFIILQFFSVSGEWPLTIFWVTFDLDLIFQHEHRWDNFSFEHFTF